MNNIVYQANPYLYFHENRQTILKKVTEVLDSGTYINGKEVQRFEENFANFCGVAHAVGVANGTDAIEITLRALNIGPGNLVFTVAHTAVATVSAIERAGAIPVFVDITEETYTMCPNSLALAIEKAQKGGYQGTPAAIIPVHLYGCCADMDNIMEVAQGIPVIEDCAQAHGAQYKGKPAGSIATAGTFSFYPTKNLGTYGDGGCVVTKDKSLAETIRTIREYGWKERYISSRKGLNSRLDEIHAGILNILLPKLEESNYRRKTLAELYTTELEHQETLILPRTPMDRSHVYHLFVVQCKNRTLLQDFLYKEGIYTAIHYPQPIHKQAAYQNRHIAPKGLPNTEKISDKILSLPLYPGLSKHDILRVTTAINNCLS